MRRGRSYRFVVTHRGQTPTSREFQRTVRSHAASVSRPNRVTRRRARARDRIEGEGVIVFDANLVDPFTERVPEIAGAAARTDELTTISRRDQAARLTRSARHAQPAYDRQPLDPNPSSGTYRLRTNFLSGNAFSPLQNLTTYHAPYLPGIVNHYISNLLIPIPELDGDSVVPSFRAAWLPVVFHDPVVFQVVVLFAATHYTTFADPSQYNNLYLELLTLKQSALLALIQTVQAEQTTPQTSSPGGNSRDTLIAAAAKMASYEAIFGTSEAFHLHMSTVTRLLRQHGGPATLGMNGFLARLLTFVDINSAFLLGTDLYLVEFGLSDPHMPRRRPDGQGLFGEGTPPAQSPIRSSNIVNLERFIGFMNVDTSENSEGTSTAAAQ